MPETEVVEVVDDAEIPLLRGTELKQQIIGWYG